MPSIGEPSICIPRLSITTSKDYIKNIFEQIFGNNSIERIDLVKKTYTNNKNYFTAFIHFNYWNDSSNVQAIRNRLINNQSFKIVHREPWFWKCSISKANKPVIYNTSNYLNKRIVKRYNNFTDDAYSEVIQEINNILNEEFVKTPINEKNNAMVNKDGPPPLIRQNCISQQYYSPPPLTRQKCISQDY